MRIRQLVSTLDRARLRLGLGLTNLLVATFGLIAVAGSLAVFAGATEDVTQHNGLASRDAARLRFFTMHRTDVLDHAARLVTSVGAIPVLALLSALAGYLFWRRGLRLAVAMTPAIALGVSAVAVGVMKTVVGRARPPVSLHLVSESDASFPSGHATDSTAVFVAIALLLAVFVLRRPIVRIVTLGAGVLLPVAIGASRLVLGVHWPSDVLAGWALGVSVAVLVSMSTALITRLSPPPTDQPTRLHRSLARTARVLSLQRQVANQELRAA